ncbi:MAG: S41 family peptidase, partial [Pyrinomonadaceae bacterium]
VFAVPVVAKFCESLTEFKDKKAVIVDLRGNLGGVIGTMVGLSGMLTDRPITLGTFVSGAGRQQFTVPSMAKNFKGKVVLLVDGQSMSASEMFAAGLQSNKSAVVVGERTGGQSLPSLWKILPTGAVMVYPISDFLTLAGKSLEGSGLEPDHNVPMNRTSLLQGVDPQLQKAIALIADDSVFPKRPVATVTSADPPPPAPAPRRSASSGSGSSASTDLPPPPPPVAKAMPKATPGPSDERSLKIVADFANAIGDAASLKRFGSYEAKGRLVPDDKVEVEGVFYSAKQVPDRTVVVLDTTTAGEVRTVYAGGSAFVQTNYGMNQDLGAVGDPARADLLAPYVSALDLNYVRGLKFEGDYEVDGRLRYVLSATSPEGVSIGLSFDAATKLLATFSTPGTMYTYGDYRNVDGLMLPFSIDIDRMMNIRLESINLSPKLDPTLFLKKQNCFDKPD